MILSLLFLSAAIGCYSISQLVNHNKLKWMSKDKLGFWGEDMDKRKYALDEGHKLQPRNPTWYHKYFTGGYSERWFTSTNLTVMFTDGYHACQALMFLFLSLSVTTALNFSWWLLLGVWSLIHLCHWVGYKFLSK